MRPAVGLAVCSALLGAAILLPALALEGTVVDSDGKPISGGRVCYLTGGAEALCSATDADGRFSLPDSRLDRIRVFVRGYLPRVLPAVSPASPVVLQPAATLFVRIVDAGTGEGITKGLGEVVYPSGRQRSFYTNPNGARIRTLEPGQAMVSGRADGYLPASSHPVTLQAGQEVDLVIRLVRGDGTAPESEADPATRGRKEP